MSDPVIIINEYLELIREKLPESIANDVITELETYMLEAARDQGDNNEITLESAKKVVAQFGAPGEVADEYRYSMLPETIPEEDIPTEILKVTSAGDKKQQISEPEKTSPRILGVDPSTNYSIFFFKSFALTVIWALIVSVLTAMTGPIWFPFWYPNYQWIFIIIEVIFVTIILLVQTRRLKRKKIILWKRSYPDWGNFQKIVTLPENSVPETGFNIKRIDIVASIVGVLLFTPMIFVWNHPWFILIGIPAVILFISRIMIVVKKLETEKVPYEKSRLEFGINFSLLIVLNSAIYWLFNMTLPWSSFIHWFTPIYAIFIPLFGTVLLLQVLTGAQNLWWNTDDKETKTERQLIEAIRLRKEAVSKGMVRNGVMIFAKITGWLIIFNSIIFYSCLEIAPNYNIGLFGSMILWFFGSVMLVGFLLSLYFLSRNFVINHYNSSTLIGQRTRLEAVCDFTLSSILLVGFAQSALTLYSSNFTNNTIYLYHEIFGISIDLGTLVSSFELISVLLLIIGLYVRILGNILEFKLEYKISATKRIEESGWLILIALTFAVGGGFIEYIASHIPIFMYMDYSYYLVIMIFVAFQVVTSGMKVKEMANAPVTMRTDELKNINELNEHARIANQ